MESKINKYEQYKNDNSNDEFIQFVNKKGKKYFLGYLFKTSLEQKRMFQGIINEYFYKGAEKPLKKLAFDIEHKFIFGDDDKDTKIKFLAYLAVYQKISHHLFTKDKNGNKRKDNKYGLLLPEKNRVYFDEKKDELGFDFDTALELYRNLKLGEREFYARERYQITMMFDKFYEYRELKPKIYDFVIDALKNHNLDNNFLHVIDHIISGMIKDKDKILNVLGYLKKDQKIDCEFIRLFGRSFDLEVDKTKEIRIKLMNHFDNNIEFSELLCFAGGLLDRKEKNFFDPEIISKEQMKQIINNLKGQGEKDKDGGENKISIDTFFKIICCLEKYSDKELVNGFRAACKNKIDIYPSISDVSCFGLDEVEQIIFDPELIDNEYLKKVLTMKIDSLKNIQDSNVKKVSLETVRDIKLYFMIKKSLKIRGIEDKKIMDLILQLEPEFDDTSSTTFFSDVKYDNETLSDIREYMKELKNRSPQKFKRLLKAFENYQFNFIDYDIKNKKIDKKFIEDVTSRLNYCVEVIPFDENTKKSLRNAIEKAKSSKTKEKVLDALIIIAEIVFFPLICYAIRRIIRFDEKYLISPLMSPLKKIRKAIFVLNDKKIRGAEKTDTEPK